MPSDIEMTDDNDGRIIPATTTAWAQAMVTMCPKGKDPMTAIQDGSLSVDEVLDFIKSVPPELQWGVQEDAVAWVERYDDVTGELLSRLVAYMTSERTYRAGMTEEDFLEKYHDVIERAEQHDRRRDKRVELARVIRRSWVEPWVGDWLQELNGSRVILTRIRDVSRLCGFGEAALLVNSTSLERIQLARTAGGRGKGKRTALEIRAEDWAAVTKKLQNGEAKASYVSNEILRRYRARLGRFYFIEEDTGGAPQRHEEAWRLAESASYQRAIGMAVGAVSDQETGSRAQAAHGDLAAPDQQMGVGGGAGRGDLVARDQEIKEVLDDQTGLVPGYESEGGTDPEEDGGDPVTDEPDSDSDDRGDERGSQCACSSEVTKSLKTRIMSRRKTALSEDFAVLGRALGARSLCFRHLHGLGSLMGLRIRDLTHDKLRGRLELILSDREDIGRLKTSAATYTWFRRGSRPPRSADSLGPYAYLSSAAKDELEVDVDAVLRRFRPGIRETFDRDGSVNVEVFGWLLGDGELSRLIDLEFACYKWHLREVNGNSNYGWCRAMIHSLTQQLVRQDPVYYSLYVALRPDRKVELVSYPYYTKFAVPGDKTNFRHIDVDVGRMLKTGRGANMVQGTVSFTDEDVDNCTEVALGLHHHMREWHELVQERGLETHDFVARIRDAHYTRDDAKSFGLPYYVKLPCARGEVRITLPHLPHGQEGSATIVRKTVFPWYVAVQADGTLENDEAGTWEDLAASHRGLTSPPATPSGYANKYGAIPFRFPAAVELRGLGALSDALVAQRAWDSPAVRREAAIMLDGSRSDAEVEAWVIAWRGRARERFLEAFELFEGAERQHFGGASFFQHMVGRSEPDYSQRPEVDHGEAWVGAHSTIDLEHGTMDLEY